MFKKFNILLVLMVSLIAFFSCYTEEKKGITKVEMTEAISDSQIQNAIKFLQSQQRPKEKGWIDAIVLREVTESSIEEFEWRALVVLPDGSLKFLSACCYCGVDAGADALINAKDYIKFNNRDKDFTVNVFKGEIYVLVRGLDLSSGIEKDEGIER